MNKTSLIEDLRLNIESGNISFNTNEFQKMLIKELNLLSRGNYKMSKNIVFRRPNQDEQIAPYTWIPKEVLQKGYIDKIGDYMYFNDIKMKIIDVRITNKYIEVELECKSLPIDYINKILEINNTKCSFEIKKEEIPEIVYSPVFVKECYAHRFIWDLICRLDTYGKISINDVLTGLVSGRINNIYHDNIYNVYGWTNSSDIENAGVYRVKDGWRVELPEPILLK